MRLTASPESTACVQYATTLVAPSFFSTSAAFTSVPAVSRITESELDELVVTDTIPLREDARACKKIRSLSVAGLIAETILRIYTEESVSSLFIE